MLRAAHVGLPTAARRLPCRMRGTIVEWSRNRAHSSMPRARNEKKAVTASRDSLSKALAWRGFAAAPCESAHSPRYAARTFGSSSICFASPSIVTVPESIT